MTQQYDRLKGADWFQFSLKRPVMVLGAGGISSWLSLGLARIGCELHVYDHDSVEALNQGGQMYKKQDIGVNKAEAIKNNLENFSPDTITYTYGKYDKDSMSNDIVLCGFDNMTARKLAFDKWVDYINTEDIDKSKCYFSDGRLTANLIQIYCIPGDRQDLIDKYRSDALFTEESAQVLDCTFKQTSHVAMMIGGFMTSFFTNWLSNVYTDIPCNKVPYFFQYFSTLNLMEDDTITL